MQCIYRNYQKVNSICLIHFQRIDATVCKPQNSLDFKAIKMLFVFV